VTNRFFDKTNAPGLLVAAFLTLLIAGPVFAGHKFPNVELTSHEGKVYRFQDDLIDDKVVVINFIYTACKNSCPAETARMKQVYRELDGRVGKDIQMYSISIDPELDTPERLSEYMKKFKTGPGWSFFTAPKEDTDRLRRSLGLYMEDAVAEDDMDHNLSFIMGNDRTGKWIKRSPFDDPQSLANLIGHDLFDGTVPRHGKSYALAPEILPEHEGAYLFRTRCNSCHTLGGGDHDLGPDLAGVTFTRPVAWLQEWLSDPSAMIDGGDPTALDLYTQYNEIRMPNLKLSSEDISRLVDYLRIQDKRLGFDAGDKDERKNAHAGDHHPDHEAQEQGHETHGGGHDHHGHDEG
jgi:protein SCO1/2